MIVNYREKSYTCILIVYSHIKHVKLLFYIVSSIVGWYVCYLIDN